MSHTFQRRFCTFLLPLGLAACAGESPLQSPALAPAETEPSPFVQRSGDRLTLFNAQTSEPDEFTSSGR